METIKSLYVVIDESLVPFDSLPPFQQSSYLSQYEEAIQYYEEEKKEKPQIEKEIFVKIDKVIVPFSKLTDLQKSYYLYHARDPIQQGWYYEKMKKENEKLLKDVMELEKGIKENLDKCYTALACNTTGCYCLRIDGDYIRYHHEIATYSTTNYLDNVTYFSCMESAKQHAEKAAEYFKMNGKVKIKIEIMDVKIIIYQTPAERIQ